MPSIFSLLQPKAQRGVTFALQAGVDQEVEGDIAKLRALKALKIDASLTQNHISTTEVTRNPVEEGLEITDHVDKKPLEFSVDGLITDTPLDESSLIQSAVTSVAGLTGRAFTKANNFNARSSAAITAGVSAAAAFGAAQLFDSSQNRVQTAQQILQACQDQAVLLSITTKLKTYENMILTNFNVSLDRTNGSSLPFTANLTEVRIVSKRSIGIDKKLIDSAINHSAGARNDRGNQSKTNATQAQVDQANDKSIAKKLAPSGQTFSFGG